ncbi:uncharacterized protein LOC105771955 [Gossypium raimondii]|uniref:uncharacterized protein LOC105771955 n=1 Tax=Gossypium raimondii TaxID=29730 RepID=UPI00063AAEAC|nr:uncharacterized protein LOC105771955 [Gossypium raimondii]
MGSLAICLLNLNIRHFWAIKKLKIDWINAGNNRLLELNEMEKFRAQAYENAKFKLKSRWSGLLEIVHVYHYGATEVKDGKTGFNFKVNGQRLNHYWGFPILRDKHSIAPRPA